MFEWKGFKTKDLQVLDFLHYIKNVGIDTDQAELNKLADLIGNIPKEKIDEMFRIDSNKTLWMLSKIWNIQEVIQYHNSLLNYGNITEYERRIKGYEQDINGLKQALNEKQKIIDSLRFDLKFEQNTNDEKENEITNLKCDIEMYKAYECRNDELTKEILQLKARLYDLMIAYGPKTCINGLTILNDEEISKLSKKYTTQF